MTVGLVGPHAYCVIMHLRGYPYPITRVRTRTSKWQDHDSYALHSTAVTVLVFTGLGGPLEHAHRLGESGPAVCELAGEPIRARMGCV